MSNITQSIIHRFLTAIFGNAGNQFLPEKCWQSPGLGSFEENGDLISQMKIARNLSMNGISNDLGFACSAQISMLDCYRDLLSCSIPKKELSQISRTTRQKMMKICENKSRAIAAIMKDFTAKEQILLLDRTVGNLRLFLDRMWL